MRTNEEWKAIFEEQAVSGMAVKEYCEVHDIGTASFYKYKKRIIHEGEALFDPVTVIDEEQITSTIKFKIGGCTISCDIKCVHFTVRAL